MCESPPEERAADPPGDGEADNTPDEPVSSTEEALSEPLAYTSTARPQDVRAILRRLGPVGPLALIAASMPALGGFLLLGTMKWSGPWLRENFTAGLWIYILGFAVFAGFALLPTYAQAVLAGYAFGLYTGSAAALAGIVGAAVIGYLVARRAAGDRVVALIEEQPKWRAVYDALVRCRPARALLIITLLRVPPNSPFAITNLVMASCRVRPLTYIAGTLVGIAPRTVAAVFIGATASELDFSVSSHRWYFIGGIVLTLIVIGIIGAIANRAIQRVAGVPMPGTRG
jgi:uncharacterized membrane protein YdjX (TVP38/TMEM64 family)